MDNIAIISLNDGSIEVKLNLYESYTFYHCGIFFHPISIYVNRKQLSKYYIYIERMRKE